jgi:hypothetical protein
MLNDLRHPVKNHVFKKENREVMGMGQEERRKSTG